MAKFLSFTQNIEAVGFLIRCDRKKTKATVGPVLLRADQVQGNLITSGKCFNCILFFIEIYCSHLPRERHSVLNSCFRCPSDSISL
jgi:hypothetical protein